MALKFYLIRVVLRSLRKHLVFHFLNCLNGIFGWFEYVLPLWAEAQCLLWHSGAGVTKALWVLRRGDFDVDVPRL